MAHSVKCFGDFIKKDWMENVGAKVQSSMVTIASTTLAFSTYDALGASTNGAKALIVEVEAFVEREGGIGTDVVTRDERKSYFHDGLRGVAK
jgi:hypothetical protein